MHAAVLDRAGAKTTAVSSFHYIDDVCMCHPVLVSKDRRLELRIANAANPS